MTSSFENIIGTPRGLPELPIDNYANIFPDLTEGTEKRHEDLIKDVQRRVDSVSRIAELRQQNFKENLSGLEGLLSEARGLYELREADSEAREAIKGLSDINKEERDKVNDTFDKISKLEEAEKISTLIKLTREGNAQERLIATDLLNQNVLPTEAEIKLNDAFDTFDKVNVSTFTTLAENNFLIKQTTRLDAENVADNAIRDILTDFYYEMRTAGFNIKSRQVQNYVNRKLLPSLLKEKNKQINNWVALRPSVVQQNLNKLNKSDITAAFTEQKPVTTINSAGEEVTTIEYSQNFDGLKGEGDLLEVLIARNPQIETKAQAMDLIVELLSQDRVLQSKITLGDIERFENEAVFISTKDGTKIKGYANSDFGGKETVLRFFSKLKSTIAETNEKVYQDWEKEMGNQVRDFLIEKDQTQITEDQLPYWVSKWNAGLEARGLSPLLQLPSFLKSMDGTISSSKWGYSNQVSAIGYINDVKFENLWKTKSNMNELPITSRQQIDAAKGELTRLVMEAKSKNDDAKISQLVNKFAPGVLDDLVAGKFEDKVDPLTPLLPKDTEAEVNLIYKDKNKWMNNKEPNSIYEKRYMDEYIEDYVQGGWNPQDVPTYIIKAAQAAGLPVHEYVMTRWNAMEVYDKKNMKWLTKNPEDFFDLDDYEKKYIYVKPHSSKNLLLWNGKPDGLDGKHARKALLAMRKKDRKLDSYDGRDAWQTAWVAALPGDQLLTVEKVFNLADSGEGDNFGIYGFSAQDIKDLVAAGLLDLDGTFDEDTQDWAAWGLMYLQANKSNDILGAQIESVDWRHLAGLSKATQLNVLRFFPNLHKVPINQFQHLQKDVADAILTDVEQRRWDKIDEYGLRELVDEHPSLEKILLERKGGDDGEMSLKELHPQGVLGGVVNKDTVAHVLHYTIDKKMPETFLKWAAKDKGMLALRKHFQDKITKGEFVDNYIRRQLQASRLTYNKYGDGDDFDYFSNPNSKNPIVNMFGGGGKPPEPVKEQEELELSKEVEFQINYLSKSLGISKDRARQMLKEQEKSPMSILQNKDTLTDD